MKGKMLPNKFGMKFQPETRKSVSKHRSCLARIRFPLACLILFAATARLVGGEGVKYGKTLPMGFQMVRLADTCVSLKALMNANDFLAGLKRVDTSQGPEFYSRGKRLFFFPDHVSIQIMAIATGCRGPMQPIPIPQGVRDLLASLQFEALSERKEGAQPIHISSAKTVRGLSWTEFVESSNYVLELEMKEIPLTQNVVIRVITSNGDAFAQLSGHP
jgi:hypothetical protein